MTKYTDELLKKSDKKSNKNRDPIARISACLTFWSVAFMY